MRRSLLVLFAVVLVATPATAQAAEGDIIVQRAPGLDSAERRDLREDAGVTLVETLPLERTELVEAAPGDQDAALTALRADSDVVYAELDRPVSSARVPNDTYWTSLWGLENSADTDIDAAAAWDQSEGAGVVVAVVDTGINTLHVDLAGQIAGNPGEQGDGRETNGIDDDNNGLVDDHAGWDFYSDDNRPEDGNVDQYGNPVGHGTHVSATIAAVGSNATGIVGVAPRAKVLPLRALGNDGTGWTSDIAAAFAYAGKLGVPIVNASLGGPYSLTLHNAIAEYPNTLYVVAAGNDGANADVSANAYPCAIALANIICVGASDNADKRAAFSNYGATSVDLFAPGVGIYSATIGSTTAYRYLSGTSMATPHVAGAAALALAANPGASISFLRWSLLSSVDVKPALSGLAVTGGRLNANAAVSAILGPEPSPTPTPTPSPTATPTPAPPVDTSTPAPPVATPTPAPPVDTSTPAPPVATPAPVAPIVVTLVPAAAPAPVVSNLTLSGSLRTKASKLRVSFRLTQVASVRFTIKRRGSKAVLANWSSRGRSGANSVTLTRRLPTGKTLKPGSYRLAVAVSASAKSSSLIRVP
jgi:subtilisin family serine protease